MLPIVAKKRCPKCKFCTLDTRTARAGWVKTLLFWLPITRYRCDSCGAKTHIMGPNVRKKRLVK